MCGISGIFTKDKTDLKKKLLMVLISLIIEALIIPNILLQINLLGELVDFLLRLLKKVISLSKMTII